MTEDQNAACHVTEENEVFFQKRQTRAEPQDNHSRSPLSNGRWWSPVVQGDSALGPKVAAVAAVMVRKGWSPPPRDSTCAQGSSGRTRRWWSPVVQGDSALGPNVAAVAAVMVRKGWSPPLQDSACAQGSSGRTSQCVVAVPSCSMLNPSFDLSLCRASLERKGFQIPVGDMEVPLKTALDVPSVRRYMVFNSAFFHFIMAPVLYVVVWCAVFSTLHLYITVSDYWVLCLTVSLASIILTSAIIFILHYCNKELYFVYWDMSHCFSTLVETLEDNSETSVQQNKLKSKMSHLVLVTEVSDRGPDAGGSEEEQESLDERRPLLRNEDPDCSSSSNHSGKAKVTQNYSLVPDSSLSAQAKAYQLLMTYSAAYVKLLVSEQFSGQSQHHVQPRRSHCTTTPVCLCQYIKMKIL
ncbi:transmembrane protein 268 isoform 2-T2 [Pholidichthys leucotaenia]